MFVKINVRIWTIKTGQNELQLRYKTVLVSYIWIGLNSFFYTGSILWFSFLNTLSFKSINIKQIFS